MNKTATGSKTQAAYDWISEQITRRRFSPGYRLVFARLADEIGVSVAPVREAIRRLEAEGRVEYQQNIGAAVAMVDENAYRDTMESVTIIEAATTALSAPHLSAEDLDEADLINEEMRAMVSSIETFEPSRFTELNQAFHRILFRACANQHLRDLVERDWAQLDSLRDSTFGFIPGRAVSSVEEHADLLSLIRSGARPDRIERAAREHRLATLHAYDARRLSDAQDAGP